LLKLATTHILYKTATYASVAYSYFCLFFYQTASLYVVIELCTFKVNFSIR